MGGLPRDFSPFMPTHYSNMQLWLRVLVILGTISVLVFMGTDSLRAFEDKNHTAVTVMGRTSFVYRPVPNMTSPLPGILVLHGSGGVATDMYDVGFERLADIHKFLVVYPEMKVPRADIWGYKDDIPFFFALCDRLQEADIGLDRSQTFVVGHSAGGTMSLFLQNQMDVFAAVASVEAAVGHLQEWDMSRPGHRAMVVWNHADPVLHSFAPGGSEAAYYNLTLSTLRRHGSLQPWTSKRLPTSQNTLSAELVDYRRDAAPELLMLSWRSDPGTHAWPKSSKYTFDAAEEVMKFFLETHSVEDDTKLQAEV